MSKISVAMTTYNGEKYIIPQLYSVLNQSVKPDEVIICDDCSTDSTVSLINEFINENKLTNFRLISNENNLGYIKNFRKAISLTSGDIIFLCDQDDIWQEDKIKIMAELMENNKEIKALASAYKLIDAEGNEIKGDSEKFYDPKGSSLLSKVNYGKSLYYNIAQGCAEAVSSDIAKAYCQSTAAILPHDWALNLLAYEKRGLYFINRELLLYRLHGNNTTGISDKGASVEERIPRLKSYAAYMRDIINLPLQKESQSEYLSIASLTEHRINFLTEKRLSSYIKGFFKHFTVIRRYFFMTYLKDLYLVLLRKI